MASFNGSCPVNPGNEEDSHAKWPDILPPDNRPATEYSSLFAGAARILFPDKHLRYTYRKWKPSCPQGTGGKPRFRGVHRDPRKQQRRPTSIISLSSVDERLMRRQKRRKNLRPGWVWRDGSLRTGLLRLRSSARLWQR